MRTFAYKKLVRDKIVDDAIKNGDFPKFKVLNKSDYILELKNKLGEEVKELLKISSLDKILYELADIQEIIDNLLYISGISKQKVTQAQKSKNLRKGSFKKRHYIEYVSLSEKSEWVDYFLKHPDQYPEIKI